MLFGQRTAAAAFLPKSDKQMRNLNVIIISTNKNVPVVYKTHFKHRTFIKRKTNTAMKASVINEMSHADS